MGLLSTPFSELVFQSFKGPHPQNSCHTWWIGFHRCQKPFIIIISHPFTKMSQALAFFLGKIVTEKAEGLARPSLWSHLLQSPPVSTTIKGSRKQCRLHLRQAGPHDENTVWFESRTSDPTLRNTSTIQWCVAERFAFISITSRTWEV